MNIPRGTLALMVLKTLEIAPNTHAYGIARRIEKESEGAIKVPYGSIHPTLTKLKKQGYVYSYKKGGPRKRHVLLYVLRREGNLHLKTLTQEWERQVKFMTRVLRLKK